MPATFSYTTNAKGEVTLTVALDSTEEPVSRTFPSRGAALVWLEEVEAELLAEEVSA
jgi:hypothetical protein